MSSNPPEVIKHVSVMAAQPGLSDIAVSSRDLVYSWTGGGARVETGAGLRISEKDSIT